MSRLSSFTVTVVVLLAFVLMASHLGMIDHSSMDTTAAPAVTASVAGSGTSHATSIPAADHSMPAHNPTPAPVHGSGMSMIMICDLMVLVTAFGCVLLRIVASSRAHWIATIRGHLSAMFVPPALRAERPPGLSMLCVVRC